MTDEKQTRAPSSTRSASMKAAWMVRLRKRDIQEFIENAMMRKTVKDMRMVLQELQERLDTTRVDLK